MLNNILYIFMMTGIIFSQNKNNYITYQENEVEYHYLQITQDTLSIIIPHRKELLFPKKKYSFKLQQYKNKITLKSLKKNYKSKGVYIEDKLQKEFINYPLIIQSENKLLLTNVNRPYLKKNYIDSLTGGQTILILDKIIYTKNDSIKLKKAWDKYDSKEKQKYTSKILKSEKAYKKYGAIGIYGAIELNLTQ